MTKKKKEEVVVDETPQVQEVVEAPVVKKTKSTFKT